MLDLVTLLVASATLAVLVWTARFLRSQIQVSRELSLRAHHLELVRLSLEHQGLVRAVVPDVDGMGEQLPLMAYRNLWFMYFQLGFTTGGLSEDGLRRALSRMIFINQDSLDWWSETKVILRDEATDSRQYQRFIDIAEDEARHANNRLRSQSS